MYQNILERQAEMMQFEEPITNFLHYYNSSPSDKGKFIFICDSRQ